MYRCDVCKTVSKPGQSRRVHVIQRVRVQPNGKTRREIACEIPVCADCKARLDEGLSIGRLREVVAHTARMKEAREQGVVAPAPKKRRLSKATPGGVLNKGVSVAHTDDKPWRNGTAKVKKLKPKTKKQRKEATKRTEQ